LTGLVAVALAGSAGTWDRPLAGDPVMREIVPRVADGLEPLDLDTVQELSTDELSYFSFYQLPVSTAALHFGTIDHGDRRISVHIYRPEEARATALVVHGYLDHVGGLSAIIRDLVQDGYNVVTYDQPGHGLSDGAAAAISDFVEYSDLFVAVVSKCSGEWGLPGPVHVVAHSMGCSAVMDALLAERVSGLGRVVFVTPLVRSAHWHASGLGVAVASPFRKQVPRLFRKKNVTGQQREFLRNDPLQARSLPLSWVRANRRWFRRVNKSEPSDRQIVILQGMKDAVVDHRYNVKWLAEKFPDSVVIEYPNCGHRPMNESGQIRDIFLSDIRSALEPGAAKESPTAGG